MKVPLLSKALSAWQCGALLCLLAAVHGTAAEESPALASARRALQEGLPKIALQKLETSLKARELPSHELAAARWLLAEAQLEVGRLPDALTGLAPLVAQHHPEALLLQAQALAQAHRWPEALAAFRQVRQPDSSVARLGEAESLHALGRDEEAELVLESVLRRAPENVTVRLRLASIAVDLQHWDKARRELNAVRPSEDGERHWKQYVQGRLWLAQGHPAPALSAFDELLREPESLSERLLAGASLGAADARIALQGYDAGDKPLETFIGRYPENAWLEEVFRRLDQVYAQQRNPPESELQKWAARPPLRRAALARYYVARLQVRAQRLEKAAVSIGVFLERYPEHPLLPDAYLLQADLLLGKGSLEAAVRALDAAERAVANDGQRGEIELRRGLVLYAQGQFLLAGNEFHRAADHAPQLFEHAAFNAALSSIRQRNYERFQADYLELSQRQPDSGLRAVLLAEEGLSQARFADSAASKTLEEFLHAFPRGPRQDEARLALAELAYEAHDSGAVAHYLRASNEAPRSEETEEHAEYLAIFQAEAQNPGDDEKAIAQARSFIRKHPHSPLLSEVRMKLGQVFFRSGDFAGAETQLATLAQDAPDSQYAEAALFLAGQAAMQSINAGAVDRALRWFDEVVKRDGPLKLYARQQQAIVQGKLGKESEAVILYDAILSAQPPPEAELRYAALAGKGESLSVLGRRNRPQLEQAATIFGQLAALPEVPPLWRNLALYREASALQALGRQAEALTAFYDVLDGKSAEGPEYFWYYKAGFDLAGIFEQQSDWKAALGIYQKMARVAGPRAADAAARARDLRLKHFLWD